MLVEKCILLLESIHNREWGTEKISPGLKGDKEKAFGAVIDKIFQQYTGSEFRRDLIKYVEIKVSLSPLHSPISKEEFAKIVEETTAEVQSKSPLVSASPDPSTLPLTRLQAEIRRLSVQKKLLLPSKIKPLIDENFPKLSDAKREALAFVIARQSVEMMDNPKAFQGEGKRVNSLSEEKWTDPVSKETKTIKTPNTIWMHLSDDRTQLRIQVYSKKHLGSGTYKIVKASKTLVIDLSKGRDTPKKVVSTAFIKSKDLVTEEEREKCSPSTISRYEDKDILKLRRSMRAAGTIFTSQELRDDPEIHIKALPDVTHTYTGKANIKRLEWEEPLYFGSDYNQVIKKAAVEVDDGVRVRLTPLDKLRIVKSVIYTTQKMHEKGVVHRDVKGKNTFIGYDGKLQGYLGDFDLTAKFGVSNLVSDYAYWDRCSCMGLVLPTTDIFGGAMLLAESFLGADVFIVSEERFDVKGGSRIPKKLNKRARFFAKVTLKEFYQQYESKLNPIDTSVINSAISDYSNKKGEEAYSKIRDHIPNIQDAELASAFRETLATMQLIDSVSTLLKEVFIADYALVRYLGRVENRALLDRLARGDRRILKVLYRNFPIFENLLQRVSDLETQWNSTAGMAG